MPRPIWKGHLSFGLVMIPVVLYSAEAKEHELGFDLLDSRDHARIKYQRVNAVTGREVPWKSIVKGFKLPDNTYVEVKPEDFKRAAPKASRTVEISDFVDRDAISPKYFVRPYLVEPQPEGEKGYELLRATMWRVGRIAVATAVLHTREHLVAIVPEEEGLVLNTMRFHDELREVALPKPARGVRAVPREIDMAEKLIESMTAEWEPEKYKDRYRDTLRRWIQHKAKSGGIETPQVEEEAEEGPAPYSIMDLLRQSVEKSGTKKSSGSHGSRSPSRRKAS